jgi:cellulose biosynthesis protein BcsQ
VESNGRIITFYSYKGGTGRSMALANVAWVLATNRKRVLMIDWDLEAPGLHRYFRPFLIDKYLASSNGLIDFVMAYADQVIRPTSDSVPQDWYKEYTDIGQLALAIDSSDFPEPGKIDLIPAGRQGATYATLVSSFDWFNFYDRLGGGAFFEAVKQRLRTEYDYILIDSRTGVSDTSGICTVQMPDALAVCFTYNNQSIEGAAAIARSARDARRQLTDAAPLDIFPIPTRVEQAEQNKLRSRQKFARSVFDELLDSNIHRDAYWQAVEIPYVPFYGYEETLAPFADKATDPKSLLGSIIRITRYITVTDDRKRETIDFNSPISEDESRRIRLEFAATPGAVSDEVEGATTTNESPAEKRVQVADSVFLHFSPRLQNDARRLLTRFVRVTRREDGGEFSRLRLKRSEFDSADDEVFSTLKNAELLTLSTDTARGEQMAELADDALVRNWGRLRDWIEKDRDFLVWRLKLRDQVLDWERSDRKRYLLRGDQVQEATKWLTERRSDLNGPERDFIKQSDETDYLPSNQSRGDGGRAFIIRPFGIKKDGKGNDIDFNEVSEKLIAPALAAIDAQGRETLDILESGNIRIDMFRRLLTADLVVADVSIHYANVFYELGIRHALREHGTVLLRSDADYFPFDLQTDQYLIYDKNNPAACLGQLIETLRSIREQTYKDYTRKDSPVFMSLPGLTEPDPSIFNPVPQSFGEDVRRAANNKFSGDLALLSYEAKGFEWELLGWRLVGKAQFDMNALAGAKDTWENVRKIEPQDLEANIRLGTIYGNLDDIAGSNQALERALNNPAINKDQRAEAYSLVGRNSMTHWRKEWESKPANERASVALRSRYLKDSFENYESAFNEHLNHFYAGLNALAMLKVMIALAELLPNKWVTQFPDDEEAERALKKYKAHATRLQSGVQLSLDAAFKQLEREDKRDVWAEISKADLAFITTNAPERVANAYGKVLSDAPDFARVSVAKQLAIYRDLGVMTENLAEVFKVVSEPPALPESGSQSAVKPQRQRVLLFAGHMIDPPDRTTPRFPADKEAVAREEIKQRVRREMNTGAGVAVAYAGGSNGGDILFQEVCAELGVKTRLYLAVQPQIHANKSVNNAGRNWMARFWGLHDEHLVRKQVRVLSQTVEVADSDTDYLPAWLRDKTDYDIWQRRNLWMLLNALAEGFDAKTGDPNLTLIALWDGSGDGPGGTGDLVKKVASLGARVEIINTKELFRL